jgi:hypothetical protein
LKRSLYFLWIFITLYYILYTGCGTFPRFYHFLNLAVNFTKSMCLDFTTPMCLRF